jgi:methylmalonyl-CoA epimerase
MDSIFKNRDFKLDHIGIAVETLEMGKAFYEGLGFKNMYIEEVPSEKVRVGMFELLNEARIELLEPTHETSPISKFLKNRGPGIHHICFKVEDIQATMKKLTAQGYQLLSQNPVVGAHNCLVVFVHPKSTGGVLIELSQTNN